MFVTFATIPEVHLKKLSCGPPKIAHPKIGNSDEVVFHAMFYVFLLQSTAEEHLCRCKRCQITIHQWYV